MRDTTLVPYGEQMVAMETMEIPGPSQCEYCHKEFDVDLDLGFYIVPVDVPGGNYCSTACEKLDKLDAARAALLNYTLEAIYAGHPYSAQARAETLASYCDVIWGKGAVEELLKEMEG